MRTVAILPMKRFSEAKRRLRTGLDADERRTLVEAMFCDVLIALRHCSAIDLVLVVTADHAAQRIAGTHGAEVLDDAEHGHNVAARHGIEQAKLRGAQRVLLVPGDCPTLDPEEVGGLLSRPVPERSVLIAADRHGTGTNALVLRPPDVLAPSFGEGSCSRHLDGAEAAGVHGEVVHLNTLALDVDTAEDLHALELSLDHTHGRAVHTRGLLEQLQRSRAG